MNGRTVHSLIKALCRFKGNSFVLISTPQLRIPSYIKDILNAVGAKYCEVNTLEEAMSDIDVLYMTRIQRERFSSDEEYERQKGVYVLDKQKMKLAKSDLKILHPLPRVDEITIDVDDDPRAVYFDCLLYTSLYTFQSRSSLSSKFTVFQTCWPACTLSAKKPPVLPSRLS